MDEDGRLRTVYLSISSRGQRTKIFSQTVHLMDVFGRWTKIIILRRTNGRIFDDGPSTSWSMVGFLVGYRIKNLIPPKMNLTKTLSAIVYH